MHDKPPRVERTVTAGFVLTRAELTKNIGCISGDRYESAVPVFIRAASEVALKIGKEACTSGNKCPMTCSATPLLDTVSIHDADITLRCESPTCDNSGISEGHQALTKRLIIT